MKHFSKYGLVDDSDEEDLSEQEKKRLKSSQQQQMAVQVSEKEGVGHGVRGEDGRDCGGNSNMGRTSWSDDLESSELSVATL